MAVLTVRKVSDEIHRALRLRAAKHGRSTEAEVRHILESAVKPQKRLRMGEALSSLGRKLGLKNEDFALIEQRRERKPAEPMKLK